MLSLLGKGGREGWAGGGRLVVGEIVSQSDGAGSFHVYFVVLKQKRDRDKCMEIHASHLFCARWLN